MERLFLIGAVASLVVSWLYIFLLKTKLRDCMTYIHNRIDTANCGLVGPLRSPASGHNSMQAGNAWCSGIKEAATPALEKTTMEAKPKLIVGGSDSPLPLHYLCSYCLRPFYLPGNQPPKEAVAELLQGFREHVEREHRSPGPDSNAPQAEAGKRDSR